MKIYLVGGAVRDKLLGLPVTERDYVVVGATVSDMIKLKYKQVGKEFPVFLHPKTAEEYALARMETKVKPGYKGFEFDTTPQVTLEADLIRRDLTINAMAEDENGKLIDPYHGKADLDKKVLRHVSAAFKEDPVRILRVGRFLARFANLGFSVAPETIELMQSMVKAGEINALVPERVWKELERALGEKDPVKFFDVLAQCHALAILFPELSLTSNGMIALRAASSFTSDTAIRFAVLLHDLNRSEIQSICKRYRTPNAYKELALITEQFYPIVARIDILQPIEVVELFAMLDIYRRQERFKNFVLASEIISTSQNKIFNKNLLLKAATAARSIDIKSLLNQGLKNSDLAAALTKKRTEAIKEIISN